jgi:hypothetical protein
MEEIKEYINKDLYGQSYKQFCEHTNIGLNINEESLIGKIEWALLMLDAPSESARAGESLVDFSLRKYDGVNLMVERFDGSEMSFLNPEREFGINADLFDYNFDSKIMNFGGDGSTLNSMVRFKELSIEEKRGICQPHEKAYGHYLSFYSKENKWFNFYQNYKSVDIFKTNCIHKDAYIKGLEDLGIFVGKDVTIAGKVYSWEGFVKNIIGKRYLSIISNKPGFYYNPNEVMHYTTTNSYLETVRNYQTAISCQLTFHYEWHLYLKENSNSIGFKIPFLPSSFKEISALRNLEKGDKRKTAILHFVNQHYRRERKASNYNEAENKILVSKYLRGETKFNWNGLEVNLIPSRSDIINTKSKKKFLNI